MTQASITTEQVPWYLWPFWAVWRLLTWIVKLTGRLIAIILGFAMIIIGAVLCITVILLPLGIPLIVFGFLLTMRGLF
ncbi:MAG TPA: hypothetical protein VMW34_02335 [Anaerolineales bacterium]|jgi:hypothetical protein|nr:hypothetical protein [Anaerolineales bacterium]